MSRSEQLIRTADLIDALENSLDMAETDDEREDIERRIGVLVKEQYRDGDACIYIIHRWEKQHEAAKELQDRVSARGQIYAKRAKRMRERLAWLMATSNVTKVEGLTGVITLRPGSERVDITGEVPAEYCTVQPEVVTPDKTRIKQAIRQGIEVPGARLVTGAPVVQIR